MVFSWGSRDVIELDEGGYPVIKPGFLYRIPDRLDILDLFIVIDLKKQDIHIYGPRGDVAQMVYF